ncbi:MAG: sulfotransferase [Nanoarchaeota archaeon]
MNLVFLCYISRSGSTFLAKELNKYSDIKVSIEGEFFDGYARPFPKINNEADLKQYLDKSYNERPSKLKYWGIDKNELYRNLKQNNYPITYRDVLLQLLDMYFNGIKEDEIVIYKAGSYHKYVNKVIGGFGSDVKFLFINRDPRSIYNSQKKSLGSETNKPFITSIEKFVKTYKEDHEYIQQHSWRNNFYIIKYENLIADKTTTLSNVLKFIGSKGIKGEENDYFDKIPEKQKNLHKKLTTNEDKSRIKPWKNESSPKEIFLLQKYLKKYLKVYGYEFESFKLSQSSKFYITFLKSKIRYFRMHTIMPFLRNYPLLYNSYKATVNKIK